MARARFAAALLALLGTFSSGCGLLLATPGGETKIGEIAAQDIEEKVGFVEMPALETYVQTVGKRLAEEHGVRSGVTFEFHVVDMVEPNAFALPGGHIYVSRGLLVLLNDEDELANVLGHEVGHVSARHHMKHAMLETPFVPVRLAAGIAGAAVNLVAAPLGRLGAPLRASGAVVSGLGGATGIVSLSAHSRAQESEADAIGQKLAAAGGWDPLGMTRAMEGLSRYALLHGHDPEIQSFVDTHPSSPKRAELTAERAATLQRAGVPPVASDRAHFLAALEGLLVGEPASNGVVVGSEFLHSELDLRLAFPEGWEVENGTNNVTASPPDDEEGAEVFVSLTVATEGDDPEAVAREVLAKSSLRVDHALETGPIGELPSAHAAGLDRHQRKTYRVAATWIAHGGLVYQVLAAAHETQWEAHGDALTATAKSFRPLLASDRARITEGRLRVVKARAGESLGALLARHTTPWNVATAAAVNALAEDVALDANEPVKLSVSEVYSPSEE
jgi:predicted Zn-dependent protease